MKKIEEFTEYIYTLTDPRTNEIRYVGRTTDVKSRYSSHLSKKEQSEKGEWIRELRRAELKPVMTVVETVIYTIGKPREATPGQREYYWIRKLWSQGQPLFNKMFLTDNPNIVFETDGSIHPEVKIRQLEDKLKDLQAENKRLRSIIQQISHLTKPFEN